MMASLAAAEPYKPGMALELRRFIALARPPKTRTMREWCEQDFVIPKGRYKDRLWRGDRQPWASVLIDAYDSKKWSRFVITGCVQSGKTLMGVVLPALYHLFELNEEVICGLPTLKMAQDKWEKEFVPVIMASSRFRAMLTDHQLRTGGGRVGPQAAITFRNGVTLKFMSGHGADEERSAYTAKVLVVTEADRLDKVSEVSSEGSQLDQLEMRVASWGFSSRIYLECTVTTETACVWSEYTTNSTRSRLASRCPHCSEFVTPERDELIGYEGGFSTAKEAGDASSFFCPACGEQLTDKDRSTMQIDSLRMVHHGQRLVEKDGGIELVGEPPNVRTLGFRWNAFNNLFWTTRFIAEKEWGAKYRPSKDERAKETSIRQGYWALPRIATEFDLSPLDRAVILEKHTDNERLGVVPEGTTKISVGIDLRGTELHFLALAYNDTEGSIFHAGIVPIDRDTYGTTVALFRALRTVRDVVIEPGWRDAGGKRYFADWAIVDGGWKTPAVRAFLRECDTKKGGLSTRYMHIFGRGQSEPRGSAGAYNHPAKTSTHVQYIGDQFFVKFIEEHKIYALIANSDEWKSKVQEALSVARNCDGALRTFQPVTVADYRLLREIASNVAAEKAKQREVKGRGYVICWVNETERRNHYLDCLYYAMVGIYLSGYRVLEESNER